MTRITKQMKSREAGLLDGEHAAYVWFRDNMQHHAGDKDSPHTFPSDMSVHPEKYGFVQKFTDDRKNVQEFYKWGWQDGFEQTIYKLYANWYDPMGHKADDFVIGHGLSNVDTDTARAIYDFCNKHSLEFVLYIKCDVCHTISAYAGYPAVPELSTVMCLTCGAMGAPGPLYLSDEIIKQANPKASDGGVIDGR